MFHSTIFEQPRMVELAEYIKHQGWVHLLEKPVPSIFESEVRQFYYTMKFFDDGLSLSALVQGNKVKLDEEDLAKILDVPFVVVRLVLK